MNQDAIDSCSGIPQTMEDLSGDSGNSSLALEQDDSYWLVRSVNQEDVPMDKRQRASFFMLYFCSGRKIE
jgi:hypothetical protein